MFAKAFIPGLVLGLLVGLTIGVFASPYILDRSPEGKMNPNAPKASPSERDARPATPPSTVPEAKPVEPKPAESKPAEPKTADPASTPTPAPTKP